MLSPRKSLLLKQRVAVPGVLFVWLILLLICCPTPFSLHGEPLTPASTSVMPNPHPPDTVLPAEVHLLSPIEAYGFIKLNPELNLIDLRDAWEVEGRGTIAGAARMSYMEPTFRQHFHMAVLRKDRPILLYCALGTRGKRAAKVVVELGYKDVHVIEGGLRAWIKAGLPLSQ